MSPNIDHQDALGMLEAAYDLLTEFETTIEASCEGDHPELRNLRQWLSDYEAYCEAYCGR